MIFHDTRIYIYIYANNDHNGHKILCCIDNLHTSVIPSARDFVSLWSRNARARKSGTHTLGCACTRQSFRQRVVRGPHWRFSIVIGVLISLTERCIISARSGTRSDLGRWSSNVSQCSLAQTLAWLAFHLLAMVILTLALRCILIDSGSAAAIDEPASERAYAFSHKRAMRHFGYAIGVPTHVARVGILRVDFSPRMKNPAISSPRSFLRDRNTCWASESIRNFLNGIGIDSSS